MDPQYPIRDRGYRACEPLDSNNTPREALRGPSPNIHGVNMDELTHGHTKGNLESMLHGIPEGTKKQVGM